MRNDFLAPVTNRPISAASDSIFSPFEAVDWRGQTGLLTGRGGIFHLSHSWQVQLYLMGHTVQVIDCAIRFNAFYLADEAMRLGIQTEAILQSILVQRAYSLSDPGRCLWNSFKK